MTYKIAFSESAKKEWDDLPSAIKKQFMTKLSKIIEYPRIPKNKLSDLKDCYKIKLRASGYRLVYRVYDDQVIIEVIAIGKRDKALTYKHARQRLY